MPRGGAGRPPRRPRPPRGRTPGGQRRVEGKGESDLEKRVFGFFRFFFFLAREYPFFHFFSICISISPSFSFLYNSYSSFSSSSSSYFIIISIIVFIIIIISFSVHPQPAVCGVLCGVVSADSGVWGSHTDLHMKPCLFTDEYQYEKCAEWSDGTVLVATSKKKGND